MLRALTGQPPHGRPAGPWRRRAGRAAGPAPAPPRRWGQAPVHAGVPVPCLLVCYRHGWSFRRLQMDRSGPAGRGCDRPGAYDARCGRLASMSAPPQTPNRSSLACAVAKQAARTGQEQQTACARVTRRLRSPAVSPSGPKNRPRSVSRHAPGTQAERSTPARHTTGAAGRGRQPARPGGRAACAG